MRPTIIFQFLAHVRFLVHRQKQTSARTGRCYFDSSLSPSLNFHHIPCRNNSNFSNHEQRIATRIWHALTLILLRGAETSFLPLQLAKTQKHFILFFNFIFEVQALTRAYHILTMYNSGWMIRKYGRQRRRVKRVNLQVRYRKMIGKAGHQAYVLYLVGVRIRLSFELTNWFPL